MLVGEKGDVEGPEKLVRSVLKKERPGRSYGPFVCLLAVVGLEFTAAPCVEVHQEVAFFYIPLKGEQNFSILAEVI